VGNQGGKFMILMIRERATLEIQDPALRDLIYDLVQSRLGGVPWR